MTSKEQLKTHQEYYHTVWSGILDELKSLLPENGFTLKGADIGNVHGEVHADADEATQSICSLHRIMIAPTQTGKLSIKLDFVDRRQLVSFADKLKAAKSATKISDSKKNEYDRYEITYYFLDSNPPKDPVDAEGMLLERTTAWLNVLRQHAGVTA